MIETQTEQDVFEEAAFRAWMRKVDAALRRKCSLTSDDLPDFPYRDEHDNGADPADVADEVLESAGYDG